MPVSLSSLDKLSDATYMAQPIGQQAKASAKLIVAPFNGATITQSQQLIFRILWLAAKSANINWNDYKFKK